MATSHISNAQAPVQSSTTHNSELSAELRRHEERLAERLKSQPELCRYEERIMERPAAPADLKADAGERTTRKYPAKPNPLPSDTLLEAGRIWLHRQQERQKVRTIENNDLQLRTLLRFFGDLPLVEFHVGHFEHYQAERSKRVAASSVNKELNALSQILRLAGLWSAIRDRYRPLPPGEPKAVKIFTAEEQTRLYRTLRGNPMLELAEIVFTITHNTTASGCELRLLRLRDLELEASPPRIHIPIEATKNSVRPRTIPLNEEGLNAFHRAVARAKKLGSHYPESYLFPLRVNRALYDSRKPASRSWLNKQTLYLRKLTGIKNVTPHVFRHLAVTELLEKGAPEQTVVALAGRVGKKMFEVYGHARIQAKADAVQLLAGQDVVPAKLSKASSASPDLTHPSVQAEIQRQVQLALQTQYAISAPARQEATSQPHHAAGSTFLSNSTYRFALNLQKASPKEAR